VKITREQLAKREWLYADEVASFFSLRTEPAIELCMRHGGYCTDRKTRMPTAHLADLAMDLTRDSVGFRRASELGLVRRCDKCRRYITASLMLCKHCGSPQEEEKEEKPVSEPTTVQPPKKVKPIERIPVEPLTPERGEPMVAGLAAFMQMQMDLWKTVEGLRTTVARLESRDAGAGAHKETTAKLDAITKALDHTRTLARLAQSSAEDTRLDWESHRDRIMPVIRALES